MGISMYWESKWLQRNTAITVAVLLVVACFGFTNKLLKGETIQIYNYGNCRRDFTYVDDIVEGVYRVMQGAPERKKGEDGLPIPPYPVYNIGGGQPEKRCQGTGQ